MVACNASPSRTTPLTVASPTPSGTVNDGALIGHRPGAGSAPRAPPPGGPPARDAGRGRSRAASAPGAVPPPVRPPAARANPSAAGGGLRPDSPTHRGSGLAGPITGAFALWESAPVAHAWSPPDRLTAQRAARRAARQHRACLPPLLDRTRV